MFFSFDKVEFSSSHHSRVEGKESFSKAVLMRALAPVLTSSASCDIISSGFLGSGRKDKKLLPS